MKGGDGATGVAAKMLSSSGSNREGGGRSVRGSGMPAIAPLPELRNSATKRVARACETFWRDEPPDVERRVPRGHACLTWIATL